MAPPTPQRTPTGRWLSSSTFPCASLVLRPSACHLEVAPTTTATCLRVEFIADSLPLDIDCSPWPQGKLACIGHAVHYHPVEVNANHGHLRRLHALQDPQV